MTKKKNNWYSNHKKPVLICGIVVLVLLIVYLAGMLYYNDKFLNGTMVNGSDVGGMTLQKANDQLSKKVNGQSLKLIFNDGQSEILQSAQLGVSYNKDNSLNQLMKNQNKWAWFIGFFKNEKNTLTDLIQISDENLTNGIASMEHAKEENQIAPTDAYIQYKDGSFSIIEETLGSKFNIEELVKNIKVALSEGKQQLDVTKANGYVKPQVYKDDQDLNNQLKAANEYCLSAITYTTPKGKEIALDGSTLITWLSKQDDGSYTKDESVFKEKLTAFVKELASQYNSIGATRTFTGKDGQSHTVSGGTYGFRVSTDSEVSALLKMINENKSENNRIPEHTGQLPSGENGGLGTTYLEINITKQHLWFVKDGSVVLESDFVSGKESDPTRLTPSGTYYIYNKERNRVLRGTKQPNGKYEYESPVSYWMPFNKGIGLHDASWRSTFGRDIYINSGSHGCINLPTGFAGSLYSQIYVNLPVVVYR
ncbi:L,D-transpeptidase family protein [Faecalibacillus intestinalis]|uniref:L,D-transpeptidase family protein n=1 Tax=Faecalibacillus intestinalis TaxID=1982626 RepID=UPI003995E536